MLPVAHGRAALSQQQRQGPVTPPVANRMQIGVATHYGMHGESLDTLAQLGNMGLSSLRDEAYWSHVESQTGQTGHKSHRAQAGVLAIPDHVARWVAAALRVGVDPLLVLSYGHPSYQNGQRPSTVQAVAGFARYADFVAQSLSGLRQFQVWNEWELADRTGQVGNANDYLSLLRVVAPRLRTASPGALVLPAGVQRAGCFNGYLEALVKGGLLRHADGLALHTYRFELPDPSPEAWYRELLELVRLVEHWDPVRGLGAAIYITEMGFPSHAGRHGLSLQMQANYLERCLLLAATVRTVRGFWWYGLRDKGRVVTESEHHYGLLTPDGQLKPSGERMQLLLARLRGASRVTVVTQQNCCWAVVLEGWDGSTWQAAWSPSDAGDSPPVWSQLKPPDGKPHRL